MQKDTATKPPKTTQTAAAPTPLPGQAFLLRTCRSCGQEKPLLAFYTQRKGRERRRKDCIRCARAEAKAARKVRCANTERGARRCPKCRETLPITDFLEDLRCRSGHRSACRRCEARLAAGRAEHREALNRPDKLIPRHSDLREQRIDLGIAIAHATCPPGQCRSREEIAAYTGLSVEAVRRIEVRALWKMRLRVRKTLEALGLEDFVQEGAPAMNAHDAYLPSGFTGEFESEVALPVKVRYAVDSAGRVEITHLCLAGAAGDTANPLLWTHLPMKERWALEAEAAEEARQE